MNTVMATIHSIRVRQWVKNLFIFLPLIFGAALFDTVKFFLALSAFIVFCMASSGIYLLNDVFDKNKDGFHPLKRNRPIALGLLDTKTAITIACICLLLSLFLALKINLLFATTTAVYILIHIFYSIRMKREVILDVIIIALGFELRIWGGGLAVGIYPSVWLQLCVFVLALFLGFIKRRTEKIALFKNADKHRNVLAHYKIILLDQMITISATLCVVFYGLYSISPSIVTDTGNIYMAYTVPFVIFGIFRYLYIVHVKKNGGDPSEILLKDFPLIVYILLWVVISGTLVYISR